MHFGERLVVEDAEADAPFEPHRAVARKAGYRAVQATPLIGRDGAPLGMLAMHFRAVHRPAESELHLLDLYARQAANFIERHRADEALRHSEQRYHSLVEMLPVAVYACEAPSGRIMYFNEQAARLWGRTPELGDADVRFCGSDSLFLPDGTPLPHDQCPMAAALCNGQSFRNADVIVQRPDRSRIHVSVNIDPIRDVNGNVVGAVNAFRDVTAIKQAEQTLRQSEERFRNIFACSNDAIFVIDPQHDAILDANPKASTMLGYSREELLSLSIANIHPNEMRELRAFAENVFTEGQGWTDELTCRTKTGCFIPAEISASRFVDAEGRTCMLALVRDITERKKAEQALRDSERRLRTMINVDVMGVLFFDQTGTVIGCNDAFLSMTGYSRAEVESRSLHWRNLTPPEYIAASELQMEQFGKTGRIGPYEKEYFRKDGSRFWMVFAGADLGDGTIAEYCIDISERKAAEQAQRDRQIWLDGQRDALEAAVNSEPLETSLGVLVHTAIEAVGEDARAAFYLANEEGTALHHVVGMPAEYAEAVDGFKVGPDSLACGLATATGQPVLTADVRNEPLWQPWLWMAEKFNYRACWSFPIHTEARHYVGTLAIYSPVPREATERDQEIASLLTQTASIIISRHKESEERKAAEQALRESTERLRKIFEHSNDAIFLLDVERDRIREANLKACKMFGYTHEEILATPISQFHPQDLAQFQAFIAGVYGEGHGWTSEFACRAKDGRFIASEISASTLALDGTTCVLALVRDITERKQAEQTLRESESRFHILADNIDQLAWTCDETLGNVTWYNQRWLEYTGLTFEEMKSWGWEKVHHPDHVDRVIAGVKRAAETGEPWEHTFPLRGKDGKYRWFLSRAVPIRDEGGNILRWFGTNTDIDDQKRAQAALYMARDEAESANLAKDMFLATLSHEMRTPLSAIVGWMHILRGGKEVEIGIETGFSRTFGEDARETVRPTTA